MFIWKKDYVALERDLATKKTAFENAQAAINYFKEEIRALKDQLKAERIRAEAAIDELMSLKTGGIVRGIGEDKRQKADITALDNIFEEEDPEKVALLHQRMADGADVLDLIEIEREF